MTIDQLRKAHAAQPFRPFDLHLADGRVLSVPHPGFLWMPPRNERTVFVTDTNGAVDIVDLLLVTSIKIRPSDSQERGRRRRAG